MAKFESWRKAVRIKQSWLNLNPSEIKQLRPNKCCANRIDRTRSRA